MRQRNRIAILAVCLLGLGAPSAYADEPAEVGVSSASKRGKRVLRWELVFTTNSAKHYLEQLDALGALVAMPDAKGKLMLIRDLKERPAKPKYEDVKALNRIYWVDDRKETCKEIAEELKLDITPSALVAFFPQKLEEEFVAKEMEVAKTKGAKVEADIKQTIFDVKFKDGKPIITVKEVKLFEKSKDK